MCSCSKANTPCTESCKCHDAGLCQNPSMSQMKRKKKTKMKKESEKKTQKMKMNLVFHVILVKNDQKNFKYASNHNVFCIFFFNKPFQHYLNRSDLKVKPTRDIYLSYKNVKTNKKTLQTCFFFLAKSAISSLNRKKFSPALPAWQKLVLGPQGTIL